MSLLSLSAIQTQQTTSSVVLAEGGDLALDDFAIEWAKTETKSPENESNDLLETSHESVPDGPFVSSAQAKNAQRQPLTQSQSDADPIDSSQTTKLGPLASNGHVQHIEPDSVGSFVSVDPETLGISVPTVDSNTIPPEKPIDAVHKQLEFATPVAFNHSFKSAVPQSTEQPPRPDLTPNPLAAPESKAVLHQSVPPASKTVEVQTVPFESKANALPGIATTLGLAEGQRPDAPTPKLTQSVAVFDQTPDFQSKNDRVMNYTQAPQVNRPSADPGWTEQVKLAEPVPADRVNGQTSTEAKTNKLPEASHSFVAPSKITESSDIATIESAKIVSNKGEIRQTENTRIDHTTTNYPISNNNSQGALNYVSQGSQDYRLNVPQSVEPLAILPVSEVETKLSSSPPTIAQITPKPDLPQAVIRQLSVALPQVSDRPVEILLNPEELGRVRMVMLGHDSQMVVQIHADKAETSELIRRHLDVLAQDFHELGYSDISFSFTGQRENREQPQEGPLPDATSHTDPTPTPSAPQLTLGQTGLDMRL